MAKKLKSENGEVKDGEENLKDEDEESDRDE